MRQMKLFTIVEGESDCSYEMNIQWDPENIVENIPPFRFICLSFKDNSLKVIQRVLDNPKDLLKQGMSKEEVLSSTLRLLIESMPSSVSAVIEEPIPCSNCAIS